MVLMAISIVSDLSAEMVHGPYVTSWFDLDGSYIVGRWADLVGADCAD
jgi:hypothetical protein